MDIKSGKGYPESTLSNFASHMFMFRGILCNSIEGLLQSLKEKNPEMQKYVCTLVGKAAKFHGKKKAWWKTGVLYWQGKEISRFSDEYQQLLDEAYSALAQNEGFQRALLATGNAMLMHSIGKRDQSETILTRTVSQWYGGRLTTYCLYDNESSILS